MYVVLAASQLFFQHRYHFYKPPIIFWEKGAYIQQANSFDPPYIYIEIDLWTAHSEIAIVHFIHAVV